MISDSPPSNSTLRWGGKSILKGHRLYWFCQITGWGAIWLSDVVTFADDSNSLTYPMAVFVGHLVYYALAIVLTHLWRAFLRHRHWTAMPLRWLWWRCLVATLAMAIVHNLVYGVSFLPPLFNAGISGPNILLVCGTYGLMIWIEFIAWTGLYLGHHAYSQLQELQILRAEEEAARRKAALQALQAQVNPHFLFNSLNTVRALISENPSKARTAVTKLAELLRTSLDTQDSPLVPLSVEMDAVRSYLHLEQLRYEERLEVTIAISPAAGHRLVPPFSVQTLVENAIKHGIENLPQGGLVGIHAEVDEDQILQIRVTNPGTLAPVENRGLGLANTRRRVQLLGGDKASLELTSHGESQQVVAILRFPQIL